MKKVLLALSLVAATLGASGGLASPTSSALGDRLDRAEMRIASDLGTKLLSAAHADLFRADIVTIRSVSATDAGRAVRMLDVLDRELARNDLQLAMPEDNSDILVHVGDSLVVAMHDERDWSVHASDNTILAPRIGVMYVRGVQAGFLAKRSGSVTVTVESHGMLPGTSANAPAQRVVHFHIIVVSAAPPPQASSIL